MHTIYKLCIEDYLAGETDASELSPKLFEKAEGFVRKELEKLKEAKVHDSSHDFAHVQRVVALVEYIAAHEGLSIFDAR